MDERAQRRAAGASSHAPLTAQGGRPRESSVWTDGTDEVPIWAAAGLRLPSSAVSPPLPLKKGKQNGMEGVLIERP